MAAVIECVNGHFYDSEKYITCPHCTEMQLQKQEKIMDNERTKIEEYASLYVKEYYKDKMSEDQEYKTVGIYEESKKNTFENFVRGWLVCTEGPMKGNDYRIHYGFNRIGRDHTNDIILENDFRISKEEHCCIVYEEKKNIFYIVPKENGIVIFNGQILKESKIIGTGDIILLGDSTLEFIAFCSNDKKW